MTDKPAGLRGRSTEAVENERLRKENEKLTAERPARKPRLKWWKKHTRSWSRFGCADSDAKRHK